MTVTRLSLPLRQPESGVEKVTAVHHAPSRRRGPAVLLAPGAGGDLDGDGLVALAEVLAAQGHPVVRANLPYREAGRRTAPRAERSVGAYHQILDAARAEIGGSGSWIVGGKSYGGRVASLAVADGMDAAGLLFYGYPLHPPGKTDRLRVDHWPHIGVPCLFLQGDRDAFCDVELLRANVRKLPRRNTIHLVEGGDHSLKVTRNASPTGTASSAAATIASLADVIRSWTRSLER